MIIRAGEQGRFSQEAWGAAGEGRRPVQNHGGRNRFTQELVAVVTNLGFIDSECDGVKQRGKEIQEHHKCH